MKKISQLHIQEHSYQSPLHLDLSRLSQPINSDVSLNKRRTLTTFKLPVKDNKPLHCFSPQMQVKPKLSLLSTSMPISPQTLTAPNKKRIPVLRKSNFTVVTNRRYNKTIPTTPANEEHSPDLEGHSHIDVLSFNGQSKYSSKVRRKLKKQNYTQHGF